MQDHHKIQATRHFALLALAALACIQYTAKFTQVHASYFPQANIDVNNNNNQQQQASQLAPSINPFSFNQNVQENQRAMLMCTTSSGETPIHFSWLKDGQLLSAQSKVIAIKQDQDASTLKISSVRLDHSGNYTCVAKNRLGQQSYSAQLIVHGQPRWLREPQQEPIVATRGQTIVIDCQTTGWPRPQQSWQIKTHQQGEFEPLSFGHPNGRISLASNGSLIIRNADKSDEANYRCKSTNGIGNGLIGKTSLRVTVPAHFETPKQQTIVVKKQTQVQLRCDAFGDLPISIEWFKNRQPLAINYGQPLTINNNQLSDSTDVRYSIHSGNNPLTNGFISQLLIKQTQRQDNAVFECVTKNPYGRDKSLIELVIQEEPDNIQELQATQINSRSVTLMWSEPYDGKAGISSYMFQYKKIQDAPPAPLLDIDLIDPLNSNSNNNNNGPESPIVAASKASSSINSISGAAANNVNHQASMSSDGDWQHATRILLPMALNSSSPGSVKSITIEKLEPSSKYLLRALANNSIGQSKFSQPMEFTTDEEAPEIGPINIRASAINSTSIQVSWDEIPKSRHLGRIHGYYIGYRVASNNSAATNFIHKPYIINDLVSQSQQAPQQHQAIQQTSMQPEPVPNQRLETILHDLRRDTVYEITVVAFNSRGSGPSSDFVVCKTIEMEAPKPVKLQIRRESNESIFIEWQRDPSDQNPVDDYVLYQEKNSASQENLQVRLPGNQTQYKAPGLKCGTRYQFYIVAQNKVGKSQQSEIVGASTSGALPVVPMKTSLIKMINSTCLLINLNSFQDNGCRIKTFTVRYRVEKTIAAASTGVGGANVVGGQTGGGILINSNGLSATHQALVSSNSMSSNNGVKSGQSSSLAGNSIIGSSNNGLNVINGGGATNGNNLMGLGANNGVGGLLSTVGASGEWINIRPKSNLKHQRANEEDRMEYLCDLNPVGEYTIHVAASNDVGRSEVEYTVLMSSDELRHSALKDMMEMLGGFPSIFAYIPSIVVFLLAGLFVSVVSLVLYMNAIKYYQKFVIMQNQMRATRRAKADEKRRRKLANLSARSNGNNNNNNKSELWADEYEEAAGCGDLEVDQEQDGDLENGATMHHHHHYHHHSGMMLDDRELDGDDEDDETSSGSSAMQQIVGRRHQRQHDLMQQQQQLRSKSDHRLMHRASINNHNNNNYHKRQYSRHSLGLATNTGHYLSNISNSAFDTSSIDSASRCYNKNTKFAAGGSTCMSTASTDSMRGGGRFQCLNAKQYVKMNEYTMLPGPGSSPLVSDIYGIAPAPPAPIVVAGPPSTATATSSNSPSLNSPVSQMSNSNTSNNQTSSSSLYYSTLRRNNNMQTYVPQQQSRQQQQQQQQQHNQLINRRHSHVADIYGYHSHYMATSGQQAAAAAAAAAVQVQAQALAAQQAAEEARHSIFVPPQQIIYSAPNIRRNHQQQQQQQQPGLFL